MRHAVIRIRTDLPDFSDHPEKVYEWENTCYRGAEEILEPDPLAREFVDIRSLCVGATIAANPPDAVVFASNPENVGAVDGANRQARKQNKTDNNPGSKNSESHYIVLTVARRLRRAFATQKVVLRLSFRW